MTEPAPPQSAPSPRNSNGLIGVIGVVIGIGGLAAGGLALEKLSRIEPGFSAQQLQQAEGSKIVATVSDTLDAQRRATAEHALAMQAIRAEITGLHEALAARSDEVPDQPQLATLIESDAALNGRVTALETAKTEDTDASTAHMVEMDGADMRSLRYVLLTDAIASGKRYSKELDRFTESLGDGIAEDSTVRGAIATLGNGSVIATPGMLYRDFIAIPGSIQSKNDTYIPDEEHSGGWWKRSTASLKHLVKIEKIDGDISPLMQIEHAKTLLSLGDVAGATEILQTLNKQDRELYENWLADAARHIDAYAALRALRAAALTDDNSPAESDAVGE